MGGDVRENYRAIMKGKQGNNYPLVCRAGAQDCVSRCVCTKRVGYYNNNKGKGCTDLETELDGLLNLRRHTSSKNCFLLALLTCAKDKIALRH